MSKGVGWNIEFLIWQMVWKKSITPNTIYIVIWIIFKRNENIHSEKYLTCLKKTEFLALQRVKT